MHQIAPVPNHNGTSAQVLAEQMMEVCHALERAASVMATGQPHGRDYQTGGDYRAARDEFLRRIGLVEALAHQYEREAIAVSECDYQKGRVG
jgi:hypothetical protein